MDPWLGPFEQDVEQFYRVALQWTDRWIGGIAAMVPNDFHYLPKSFCWATLPLYNQFAIITSTQ